MLSSSMVNSGVSIAYTVDRDQPDQMIEITGIRNQLVVWRLDRLGRFISDLIVLTRKLRDRGIKLRSLTEGIETATINGRFASHLFAALAWGRKGGQPKLLTPKKRRHAVALYQGKKHRIAEIYRLMGISKPTLYSYVEETGA